MIPPLTLALINSIVINTGNLHDQLFNKGFVSPAKADYN